MANTSRPLLVDIACRDGDPFSTCKHKFAYLTAISWEFDSPFEAGCEDQIVMKNQLGSFILATEGLYLSDTFLQGILDRVNALDAAGLEQESRALFQEFNLPAQP